MKETKEKRSVADRIQDLCTDTLAMVCTAEKTAEGLLQWQKAFFNAAIMLEYEAVKEKRNRIAEELELALQQLPLNLDGSGGLTAGEYIDEVMKLGWQATQQLDDLG